MTDDGALAGSVIAFMLAFFCSPGRAAGYSAAWRSGAVDPRVQFQQFPVQVSVSSLVPDALANHCQ